MSVCELLPRLQNACEDFEWYPTTDGMIDVVANHLPQNATSIMDIGAGDGRVLARFAARCKNALLYGIEQSTVLVQAQPDNIVPVGTTLQEQNLACLPVDFIFCNPPYSQYAQWATKIIMEGHAQRAYLVIPQRWKDSKEITSALKRRGARAKVIHSDDFLDAERSARAVVDIVEISYPRNEDYHQIPIDPFDIWFDQNISTFDQAEEMPTDDYEGRKELAKKHANSNIAEMVEAYMEEYTRLENNYKAVFELDLAILQELGVSKENVREGIKKKMAGLKSKYWQLLFDRLDTITSRLSTKTKAYFLEKLTGTTAVEFSANNAYAVVIWAIKNANRYYDEQLVTLFRDLSTFEGVHNYKSNQKTWEKSGWRYGKNGHDHYRLDYRFVVCRYSGIKRSDGYGWDFPNNLSRGCHEQLADVVAVMSNLGLTTLTNSFNCVWSAGRWVDFLTCSGDILFQVKAHINGNLHYRFMPAAIKRLNIEAGRLLGWLKTPEEAASELGYTMDDVKDFFRCNARITISNIPLLTKV